MTPTRTLARPMLAGMFVVGGIDALRNSCPKATQADKVALRIAKPLGLPEDSVTLVRINGGAQVVGGALLASGKVPRLASLLLAGSLVPTTIAGHRFWEERDPNKRAQQQIQFLKNAAMLGGLLLAAADTGGRPSVSWWVSRRMRRKGRARPGRAVAAVAHDLTELGHGTADRAGDGFVRLARRRR